METALNTDQLPPPYLQRMANRASDFIRRSRATSTLRAYQMDWSHFQAWCDEHEQTSLPASPETVVLYLSHLADDHKPSTLTRRVASISGFHKSAGYETPTRDNSVRRVLAGVRRVRGMQQNAKAPILIADLKEMIERLPDGILGVRDRALLLIGFAGGFRRSELVGLDADAVELGREGLVVTIRRSKTDPEGRGRQIGIPNGTNPASCPVRSYSDWIAASGIKAGPIFRPITRHGRVIPQRLSTNAVAEIVKRHVAEVGLDAARYSGHSLRSGLATSAAMNGASERAIMNQTGHRSVLMVRRYIKAGSLFRDNVVSGLGL